MNDTLSSHAELRPLWKNLVQMRRADSAPFASIPLLCILWVCANLPTLFSGQAMWVGLIVLGGYCIWASILYVYLRKLSRMGTIAGKHRATLLHVFNNSLSLVLVSAAMFMMGVEFASLGVFGKSLLLGLYVATLILAALFGYHWFVLPAARRLGGDYHPRGLRRVQAVVLTISASVASIGVAIGIILSRAVEQSVGGLIVGGMSVLAAFVLGAFGAGGLCETYLFARSGMVKSDSP